jgi:glycine/D-amino acid oxidase-like deaminating enzyme
MNSRSGRKGKASPAPSCTPPALRDAEPRPFWLDAPAAPSARPALLGPLDCDLAVVGAGFTGLWTALLAKERDPGREVVVLDAGRVAAQASGRNGGIAVADLAHGQAEALFPREARELARLGLATLDQIEQAVTRYGIDCGWERTGEMDLAVRPWHLQGLREEQQAFERLGVATEWLDTEAVRAEVHSPTYLGGLWHHDAALLDPARLAWGLAEAAERAGVRICEGTPVTALGRAGAAVTLRTPTGRVRAERVVLATNAFRPLLRRLRLHIVPVYDYVLVTEPLSPAQLDAVGWHRRQALADAGYLFHYYRLIADAGGGRRILWGGWDAVYHFASRMAPAFEQRPQTFARLADDFFHTFPQLEGLRFTHRWAGVIDTCSRFCAFFGTAFGGRVAYALGYTGLGVCASRFGAQAALDLLADADTELTRLELVRSRPLPFPPEPLRAPVIGLTQRSLARAERDDGRRDLWLRTLDRFGLGFDS